MVLTRDELIHSLQNEVRILLHLAGKIEPDMLDYRPSAQQRSTLELLRYLTVMGPMLIGMAQAGAFDPAAWKVAADKAAGLSIDEVLAALASQSDEYATLLGSISDEDMRAEVQMLGRRTSRGAFIVNLVLSGCAAYRTQLFLYLKACGRHELGTRNLWGGMDPPKPAAP